MSERTWFAIALIAAMLYLGWSLGLSTARQIHDRYSTDDTPRSSISHPAHAAAGPHDRHSAVLVSRTLE